MEMIYATNGVDDLAGDEAEAGVGDGALDLLLQRGERDHGLFGEQNYLQQNKIKCHVTFKMIFLQVS